MPDFELTFAVDGRELEALAKLGVQVGYGGWVRKGGYESMNSSERRESARFAVNRCIGLIVNGGAKAIADLVSRGKDE